MAPRVGTGEKSVGLSDAMAFNKNTFLRRVTEGASQTTGRQKNRNGSKESTRFNKLSGGKEAVLQKECSPVTGGVQERSQSYGHQH